ncbi:hypothetical protein BAMA111019_23860 [Bacillus manliponensis]
MKLEKRLEHLSKEATLIITCSLFFSFLFFFLMGLYQYIQLLLLCINPPTREIAPNYWGVVTMFLAFITGELLFRFYSRTKRLNFKYGKQLILISTFLAVELNYLWFITNPIHSKLMPYIEQKAANVDFSVNPALGEVLVGNLFYLRITFTIVPMLFVIVFTLWFAGHVLRYREEFFKWLNEYEYKNKKLAKVFDKQEDPVHPDIALGPHKEHGEMVKVYGKDRTLNEVIIGPIGSGKTSSLIIPIINQDLHWMSRYINKYEQARLNENYDSEEVKGTFLSGITVIEPSNDLCQKVYKLCRAHNIPEEVIFYIDPSNPDTKCINILRGPVDKVAEVFTMVIAGLSESNNAFFEQAQRNHLKQHIYLLKLHEPTKDVIFDDLIDMYNDVELVHQMHIKLKQEVEKHAQFVSQNNYTRDEYNQYLIIKGVDEWFANTIRPIHDNKGEEKVYTTGKYRGQPIHFDAEAEYVKGLRNILNDLASNMLIRRVLFGKSDFDFDVHLEAGGILLVNTDKGNLAELSNVLGKFVLLSRQNAVFRRKPNISPYHHLVVDEFPDYVVRPFKEFPAQSRKYKLILTIASQTLSQLALDFSEHFMFTLLGSFRNKMIFGDATPYDAEIFSKLFGQKETFAQSDSEQSISPLQDSPESRMGASYQKTKEDVMSPADIMNQGAFICAVRIVKNNSVQPVQQITSNFVLNKEFIKAIIQTDPEKLNIWLDDRRKLIHGPKVSSLPTETDNPTEILQAIDDLKKRRQSDSIENSAISDIAAASNITDITKMTDVSDVSDILNTPKEMNIVDMPEIRDISDMADISEITDVSDVLDIPQETNTSDIADISKHSHVETIEHKNTDELEQSTLEPKETVLPNDEYSFYQSVIQDINSSSTVTKVEENEDKLKNSNSNEENKLNYMNDPLFEDFK